MGGQRTSARMPCPDIRLRRAFSFYLLALCLLAWLTLCGPATAWALAAQAADPARGRLLYETHCIGCHNSQIHWRERRLARDWTGLVTQVRGWQARASLQWDESDIVEVARHLNETIYRFERPVARLGRGGARGPTAPPPSADPSRTVNRPETPMGISIVRLGTPRLQGEGLRIGTVRRPPRGVAKEDFARLDYYDVWYPELSPSVETMKLGQAAASDAHWEAFARAFRREMAQPAAAHALDVLAALSHHASFAIGCYCADASRCHRSVLQHLLVERGAELRA
jgi:uncharacterized protein YeaO (DUF488 family)